MTGTLRRRGEPAEGRSRRSPLRGRASRCGDGRAADTLHRVKKTSVYLEPDLDEALARRAADEGLTKAEFIRRTLAGAIQRPRRVRPQAVGLHDDGPVDLAARDEHRLPRPA